MYRHRAAESCAEQKPLSIDERVKLSPAFLRNAGQYAGEGPFLRGTIVGLSQAADMRFASVKWDSGRTEKFNVCHIVLGKDPESST